MALVAAFFSFGAVDSSLSTILADTDSAIMDHWLALSLNKASGSIVCMQLCLSKVRAVPVPSRIRLFNVDLQGKRITRRWPSFAHGHLAFLKTSLLMYMY